ncbi:uncharacterized protein BKCO1_1000653 [Diplodia corticola]|uniref:Uncharacterized protein n=1 Tax=Diplodia corticola TaxID=236234 RepID=A0A1J9S5K2_9PEZI|nr:uncharacterized protein BKCO1_1000653 [Diplodia corticola]OJD40243.1 hypothetical protein BKCO1_1000653 [Diplodia corticola]
MRSLSHPLAYVAMLLLLLFGVQVAHAGDAEGPTDVCLSAYEPGCAWPAHEYTNVPCCPADRPVCTTVMGHTGCFSLDEVEGGDVVARDGGYPYSTITLDFGNSGTLSAGIPSSVTTLSDSYAPSITAPASDPSSSLLATLDTASSFETVSSAMVSYGPGEILDSSNSFSSQSIFTDPTPLATLPLPTVTVHVTTLTVGVNTQHHSVITSSATRTVEPFVHSWTSAPASDPVFMAYTDTDWYGPITARTTPVASPVAREFTIADDNVDAITFHPLSPVTDGSGLIPSSHSDASLAARELTSISIAEGDVTTITVKNAQSTYPLALITNSAALIPSSCINLATATGSAGTPLYYTFVARGCTEGPATTVSSTSTTTSTSVISSFEKAAVASETPIGSGLDPSSELEKTTIATTTTGACGSAGTVTVVVQATPSTSTVTIWYSTTPTHSSTTSSIAVSSDKLSSNSAASADPSSSADAANTEVSMSSVMLSSLSSSVVTPPMTPTTPNTQGTPTPMTPNTQGTLTPTTPNTRGTPTPTVFNGGAGGIKVSHSLLTILTLAFFLLQ